VNKIYAIFTQYEPTYKYEENLESIWSTLENATEEAKRLSKCSARYDWVTIKELALDENELTNEDTKELVVKKPKSVSA
jgi:hypothetical protein